MPVALMDCALFLCVERESVALAVWARIGGVALFTIAIAHSEVVRITHSEAVWYDTLHFWVRV